MKFEFNQHFTKNDIKKFPQEWIYQSEQRRHVQGKIVNGKIIDLSKQIIFIKHDI